MKILQIIQRSQLRGAEIFSCQLSEQLQQDGHQVDMLVLFGKPSNLFQYPLPFHFLEADESKRWWDFSGYKKLSQFIRKGKYDLVQANAGDTLKYASLARKIYGFNAVLVFRNANKISGFLTSTPKRLINSFLMKEVDFVASVSDECKLDFQQSYPSFKTNIASLPIGTKLLNTIPYASLQEIGISGSGPFLLHVAGFVPEKNHRALIQIFERILQKKPETTLLLAGEGKLKSEIEKLVAEKNLTHKVLFLGRRNDVLKIMGCCSAFVLPSLIEGLPGVILEAFENKLPVIAYDTGGIKEVVITGKTGWLIDQGNEDAFAESVITCLSSDNQAIIQNAYQLILEKYSIPKIAEAFEKSYLKAINDNKG